MSQTELARIPYETTRTDTCGFTTNLRPHLYSSHIPTLSHLCSLHTSTPFTSIPLLLWFCIVAIMYHCDIVNLYCCDDVLLWWCIVVMMFCCGDVLLSWCIVVMFFVLLFCSDDVLLRFCIVVIMYCCENLLLLLCIVVYCRVFVLL